MKNGADGWKRGYVLNKMAAIGKRFGPRQVFQCARNSIKEHLGCLIRWTGQSITL